ncbi:MAG: DUF3999 domain-containing protein [Synergistaceae bacterium]|nr:DUF3999 domain-containing protein [Synergistaceae bacterium]
MKRENAFRKIFALSVAIIALCAAAAAGGVQRGDLEEPPSIADFEFKYPLAADDEGRVYRVRVTNDIFGRLKRSYDADLAVFDSDGNIVPFVVRDAERPYTARDEPLPAGPKTEIPLFPLPTAGGPSASMMDVVIRTGDDGQVIEIKGNGAESPGGKGGRFLADLSNVAAPPEGRPILGYSLEISVGDAEDTAAWVDVYSSDNLRDWRQIAWREPLIRLKRGDDIVTSGVIELKSSGPSRYLMLETDGIRDLPETVAVSAIIGELEKVIRQDSESFKGLRDDESRSIIYDTGGVFPASEVNFILEAPGIYKASVGSRRDGSGEWRYHGEISMSFIKNDSGESRNAPVQTRRTNDRFWRLTFRDGPLSPSPVMQMYWRPKELVFVAQGKPPYILAYGCEKDLPGLAGPDLMKIALDGVEERDIPEAAPKETPLPSSANLTAPVETDGTKPGKEWTKYVVWAVLAGGALLLSWMAWNLIRKNKI